MLSPSREWQLIPRVWRVILYGCAMVLSLSPQLALMFTVRAHHGAEPEAPVRAQSPPQISSAEQALAEADQLRAQETVDALQQAIKKYKTALSLFQTASDRAKQAYTLNGIGRAYRDLGELGRALNYYHQSLWLFRAVGNRAGEATVLNNLGSTYHLSGQKLQAIDYFNQALMLYKAVGDHSGEITVLNNMGALLKSMGEKKALGYHELALKRARAVSDTYGEATSLSNIGSFYYWQRQWPKALNYHQQSLPLWRAVGEHRGEATTLVNIGQLHSLLKEPQQAYDYYDQSLLLWRLLGDRGGEDRTLVLISQLDPDAAPADSLSEGVKQRYQQQISRARATGNRREEGTLLNQFGSDLVKAGDYQSAINCYQQVISLWQLLGEHEAEANALIHLSHCYTMLGKQAEASNYEQQVLALWSAMNNPQEEARARRQIGWNYDAAGEKQIALEHYLKELRLWRGLRNRREEAVTLRLIGAVYHDLGEQQQSLDTLREAMSLSRAAGDRLGEAEILAHLGKAYASLSDHRQALDHYHKALEIFRALENTRGETHTLQLIGHLYTDVGEKQKALEQYHQSLQLWRKLKDRGEEARALSDIGAIYAALGQPQQAIEHLSQAIWLARTERNRTSEAATLHHLGAAYANLGKSQEGLKHYGHAFLLLNAMKDWNGIAAALYGMARVERDQGQFSQSRRHIEEALRIIESLRARVINKQLRASYFASMQGYYEFYIGLLMRLHRIEPTARHVARALEISELARARNLIEMLAEAHADIRKGGDLRLRARERALQEKLNAKADAQLKLLAGLHTEAQAEATEKEIETLTTELQQVQTQIRQSSPRYASLTQPQPLTAEEIQQQVLDADTLLLEYSLSNERSFLWAVTPTAVNSYELPKREVVEAAAQRVYDMLTLPPNRSTRGEPEKQRDLRQVQAKKQFSTAAAELSRMLLTPVTQQLGKKRLVIVADGALHYLPFGALPDPNHLNGKAGNWQPLVVEHEIVNLPSASTLAVLRRELKDRKPAAKTLAVLADPVFSKDDERIKPGSRRTAQQTAQPAPNPLNESITRKLVQIADGAPGDLRIARLPFTRQEAAQIMALVPAGAGMKALDFEASRAMAMSDQLGQYRYVHFATHGLADSERPELSTIVLSLFDDQGRPQDGFLRAHEVYNLNLPAELVVLSACETGLGKLTKGEGLVSLTRGFMYAGAARVVVSLWNVNDRATAELMTKFYRRVLVEGERPAAALRAAQIEMWRDQRWEAPYYWAAFTLQGEWR